MILLHSTTTERH